MRFRIMNKKRFSITMTKKETEFDFQNSDVLKLFMWEVSFNTTSHNAEIAINTNLIHFRIMIKKTSLFLGIQISSNALNAEFFLKLMSHNAKIYIKNQKTPRYSKFFTKTTFFSTKSTNFWFRASKIIYKKHILGKQHQKIWFYKTVCVWSSHFGQFPHYH